MKFFTFIFFISASIQVQALTQTAPDLLVITEVTLQSPPPSGLESAPTWPAIGNDLVALIFTNDRVKPYLDLMYEQNKELIADNITLGDSFYQQGAARMNCNKPMIIATVVDTRYCSFEVEKSFGWYADIALGIKVSGFVLKNAIPKDIRSTEGFYLIN